MSVADLKSRMADVPGIESLSMQLEAGRISLRWGNAYSAAVDASASDYEIEVAIRNAMRLPPVSLIPDKPTPAATPIAQEGKPVTVSTPADAIQSLDQTMQEHVRIMGEMQATALKALQAKLERQRNSVAGGLGAMGDRIDQQTNDFEAIMSRWTNGAPA